MAKVRQVSKRSLRPFPWERLTWDDLADWTDSRSLDRGRSYQRGGAVKNLALLPDGGLVADVLGSHRYATSVRPIDKGRKLTERLRSRCSCPIGALCKHSVAVVLEYLSAIENDNAVSETDEDDPRLMLIDLGWDDGEDDDGCQESIESSSSTGSKRMTKKKASKTPRMSNAKSTDADIEHHLASKSKDELVTVIMQVCASDKRLKQSLVDRIMMENSDHAAIICDAKKELKSVTSKDAWYNPWEGHGNLPDYSRLQSRLHALMDAQQYDAVIELGRELIRRGVRQIESSHDEGETAGEIMSTLDIVAQAIVPSTLSDKRKILFVVESFLQDDYDICSGFNDVLERSFSRPVWEEVAKKLKKKLSKYSDSKSDFESADFSSAYRRERISDWIIHALEAAGNKDAATTFSVDEARAAGSYQRAVDRLFSAKRYEEARVLAEEGLADTDPRFRGLTSRLQDSLAKIATKRKDHSVAASIAADRFVKRPSVSTLNDLLKAAKKAKCQPAVERIAIRYLETGVMPTWTATSKPKSLGTKKVKSSTKATQSKRSQQTKAQSWPFASPPSPPSEKRVDSAHTSKPGPHFEVLIRLAIKNHDAEAALDWYDKLQASGTRRRSGIVCMEVDIADAVKGSFPDRAVDLYCTEADRLAAETNTKLYPEAVSLLKKAKQVLAKQKRAHEFEILIDTFQQRHRRKRRLIELLNRLDGKPIVSRRK